MAQVVSSNKHPLLNSFLKTMLLVLSCSLCRAATYDDTVPLLERTITISFEGEKLDAALKKISAQAGFTFSYSPQHNRCK